MIETPNFIWYELMTPDRDAAIDFYSKVLGWTAAPHPSSTTSSGPYTVLSRDGREFGGLFAFTDDMRTNNMPPMWNGYVAVPDADATIAAIKAAGGSVHMGPDDVPGAGRIAMVADPGGALFYVMTPRPETIPPPRPEPDSPACGWHELYSSQGQQDAFAFYSGLFGWESLSEMDMGPMGIYRVFGVGGERIGGMMDKPAPLPKSTWSYYFTVDGTGAAAERVTANGGTVRMGPMEVPDGSWVVQCADPQGAVFSIVSRNK
jgi:predicted enzyme related to lactoylglutathione lyase